MINGNEGHAIVGLGGMGNFHRELVKTIDGLETVGSFDIKEDRQQFARDNGLIAYDSLEDLLADERIDIVLCSTPNDAHKDIVIKALRAGKNVVCEKPVAMSSAEFQEMVDVSKETGKVFAVHQNRRWDQDFLTIKKVYEEKMLGPVWIPEKVKRVFASFTNVTNEIVEDGFTVELTFESGLTYMVEVGTSNFINLPRWYMLGREGTAVIEGFRSTECKVVRVTDWSKNDAVPIRTSAGLTKTMAPRTKDTIKEEFVPLVESDLRDYYRNIMATIAGKEEQIVKNDEVMRVMKLMEAIFESAKTHQVVEFE